MPLQGSNLDFPESKSGVLPITPRGIGGDSEIRTHTGGILSALSLPLDYIPKLEEAVGFEPTVPCGTTVFKTVGFNHSPTLPIKTSNNVKEQNTIYNSF